LRPPLALVAGCSRRLVVFTTLAVSCQGPRAGCDLTRVASATAAWLRPAPAGVMAGVVGGRPGGHRPGRGAAIGHARQAAARPANGAARRLFGSPLARRPPPAVQGDIAVSAERRERPRPQDDTWVAACCPGLRTPAGDPQRQGLPRLRAARRAHPRHRLTFKGMADADADREALRAMSGIAAAGAGDSTESGLAAISPDCCSQGDQAGAT